MAAVADAWNAACGTLSGFMLSSRRVRTHDERTAGYRW
jgi:hypothetical protein